MRTFVAVDGGTQEHKVWPQHGAHNRQRYGGGLVDDQQFGLRQPRVVLRLDVLHCLRTGAKREFQFDEVVWRFVIGWSKVITHRGGRKVFMVADTL